MVRRAQEMHTCERTRERESTRGTQREDRKIHRGGKYDFISFLLHAARSGLAAKSLCKSYGKMKCWICMESNGCGGVLALQICDTILQK